MKYFKERDILTMKWHVNFTTKVVQQKNKFNEDLQTVLLFLVEDLKNKGGYPGENWPNYGKFKGLIKAKRKVMTGDTAIC